MNTKKTILRTDDQNKDYNKINFYIDYLNYQIDFLPMILNTNMRTLAEYIFCL